MKRGENRKRKRKHHQLVHVEYDRVYSLEDFIDLPQEEEEEEASECEMLIIQKAYNTTNTCVESLRMLTLDDKVVVKALTDWLNSFADDEKTLERLTNWEHSGMPQRDVFSIYLMYNGDKYSTFSVKGLENRPDVYNALVELVAEYHFCE